MTLLRLLFFRRRLRLRLRRSGGGGFAGGIARHALTHEEQHHVCHRAVFDSGDFLKLQLLVGGDADAEDLITDFFHRFFPFGFLVMLRLCASASERIIRRHADARHLMKKNAFPGNFFLTIFLDLFKSNTRLNLGNRVECNTIQNPTRCNIMTKVPWKNVIQPGKV